MLEEDTIKLLRECDAGVKMGVSSISDVLDSVENSDFRDMLASSKSRHEEIKNDIQQMLAQYGDFGKNPDPIAQGMSKLKTNMKITFDGSDNAIADIMTDGCNMGVKSLSRYLNQYTAADEKSKNITKKLIKLEENLCQDIRSFL